MLKNDLDIIKSANEITTNLHNHFRILQWKTISLLLFQHKNQCNFPSPQQVLHKTGCALYFDGRRIAMGWDRYLGWFSYLNLRQWIPVNLFKVIFSLILKKRALMSEIQELTGPIDTKRVQKVPVCVLVLPRHVFVWMLLLLIVLMCAYCTCNAMFVPFHIYGLFRHSLNGTGTGTRTNGFLDITVILSHCNGTWTGTGTGTGTGNLTNGFPTHSGTYMVNLQVNLQGNFNVSLWSWSRSRCSVKGSA